MVPSDYDDHDDDYYYHRNPGGRKMFFRWARPLSSDPQLQQQPVRIASVAEGALQRKERISRKVLFIDGLGFRG